MTLQLLPAKNPSNAPASSSRQNINPLLVTSTATTAAGTVATAGGTRRPPTTGTHRGTISPQGRTRPTVSAAPARDNVASPAPAIHSPVAAPSASTSASIPSGTPSAHAHRVAA
jgi:hypothetical protein